MMVEKLLKLPGFLYDIGGRYYYLGKWICKECTDTETTDCVTMYHMCRNGHEEPDTNLYFQKIRAFSDFTLDIPYNPAQIEELRRRYGKMLPVMIRLPKRMQGHILPLHPLFFRKNMF